MNRFLKTIDEIEECTRKIKENEWIEHPLSCKNFDIANIVPYLRDGSLADLGELVVIHFMFDN